MNILSPPHIIGRMLIVSIAVSALLLMLTGFIWRIFSLPMSSGPLPVGVQSIDWRINERLIAVDIFYPAAPLSWWQRIRSALNINPGDYGGHATHSAQPLCGNRRFPLLLYAHGWNGSRHENRYLLEQLSSLGYIVIAPDDPRVSPHVRYADGRHMFSEAAPFLNFSSDTELTRSRERISSVLQIEVEMYRTLVTYLVTHTSNIPWIGASDFERIGMVGYSFGGSIAAETCLRDSRFLACVNIDGYGSTFGSQLSVGRPQLWINSGMSSIYALLSSKSLSLEERLDEQDFLKTIALQDKSDSLAVEIIPTLHRDYTDNEQSGFRWLHFSEPCRTSGSRLRNIINSLIGAFFDQHLRSSRKDVFMAAQKEPEIHILFAAGYHNSVINIQSSQTSTAH